MAADRRRRFLTSVLASLALVAPFALVPALPASAVPVMAMSAADLVDYLGRVDDYEITVGAAITVNDNVITVRGDKVLDLNGFFVTTRSIVLDTEAELTISATTGSGTLTASSNLDDYAGINTSNGILNITGGNVVAGGGSDAAGIGGGAVESNGELNITGGTVIAQGGRRGAGIGGGWGGGGGIINLLGGFISGLGSDGAIPTEAGGAGIGGGNTGSGGTITITQALVEAHGAVGGAGIGGGYGRELGQLTVNSGTVIATAGDGASGIGGGGSNAAGIADAGTIQINGGVVTSTGNWSFGGVNGRGIASLSIAAGAQVNAHGKFGTSLTGSIGTISIAGTLTVYNDFSVPTGSLVTIGEGGTLNGAIPLVGGGTINNHGVITNSTVASTLTITDHNYLVTFNPAPVTPTISVRVYAPTFSLGLKSFPGDPVRAGFTFDGWLDGTSPFTSTTELAGDTAVTADWVSHYALSPLATSTVAGAPVTYTVLDVTTTPATDVTGQFTFSDDTVTPYPGANVGPTLAGIRTITARHNTLADVTLSTTLTVAPAALDPARVTLAITPSSITAGGSATVTGSGTDAYGNAVSNVPDLFGYASSVASDAFTGPTVTATITGSRTITATHGALSIPLTLDVTPGTPADLEIDLGATTVNVGGTITVTAHTIDSHGNQVSDVSGSVTVTSSHATDQISGNTVHFPSASVHTITATLGAFSASSDITVLAASLGGTGADPSTPLLVALTLTLLGGAVTLGGLRLSGVRLRG